MTNRTHTFEVFEERFDDAFSELLDVFNDTRRRPADLDRFDWLYRQNPDGDAAIWTLREVTTGSMAGFAAALPRRMIVCGESVMCWNCCDISVPKAFRRQGIATALRSKTIQEVNRGRVAFAYGHPNDRSSGAYDKAGYKAVGYMRRLSKVLKTRTYFENRGVPQPIALMGSWTIDPLLRLRDNLCNSVGKNYIMTCMRARFDSRFSDLFWEFSKGFNVVGVRDESYLNWRYASNPLENYEVVTAKSHNQLSGYMIFVQNGSVISIKDLCCLSREVAIQLVRWIVRESYRRHATSCNFILLESSPLLAVLRECGFSLRPETSTMYVHNFIRGGAAHSLLSKESWFLSVGDRDV